MDTNKELWEKGDFTRIASTMTVSGEDFVTGLDITPGMEVLDLGSGNGTTAVPEARLGAEVLGVDIAANLVAAGNKRAAEEGLPNLHFAEGDAADLRELSDDSFDLTVSVFGAMFASRPADVAREMVRVTRPGGRIVMGNWIPGDPTLVAQILRITGGFLPPAPEGFVSPMTWGDKTAVTQRFADAGVPRHRVGLSREVFVFRFPGSPTELLEVFRDYYGPTMNAYAAAEASGRTDDLHRELTRLFETCNTAADRATTTIPATFLRVSVAV